MNTIEDIDLQCSPFNSKMFIDVPRKIFAYNLHDISNHHLKNFKVLSLDCFDTILFRRVYEPSDVFFDLANTDLFKQSGITASQRARSERIARRLKYVAKNSGEVTLADIYKCACPDASNEFLQKLEDEEFNQESIACYALPAMCELIKSAAAHGLQIIVVSDTYFRKDQLKKLLKKVLSENVFSLINEIYCSSEYGRSKGHGLFTDVLNDINCLPQHVLHIGDNVNADFLAPKKHGIASVHFQDADINASNMRSIEVSALSLADASIRSTRSAPDPFRGVFFSYPRNLDSPGDRLGYTMLGPLMYSFSQYINSEIDRLSLQDGKRVIPLFMMRDGWLPHQAIEALTAKKLGHDVYVSRFTAWAASFRSKSDVEVYLAENIQSEQYERMAKQLLIPDVKRGPLCERVMRSKDPASEFVAAVTDVALLSSILSSSNILRQNLISHITAKAGCVAGDRILFVDLGYSGTAQRLLGPILKEALGVDVHGCYLLQLPVTAWNKNRSGLLDISRYDHRTLSMLVEYIAVLEQMCTTSGASVIDYSSTGDPIFAKCVITERQNHHLELIQKACIKFIENCKLFFQSAGWVPREDVLRDVALGSLTRLIYFPERHEIEALKDFKFDLNVGTDDTFEIFNSISAEQGLRKRGINYAKYEIKSNNFRTNTPAEMRLIGIPYSMSLLLQHRFMLHIPTESMTFLEIPLSIILMRGGESSQASIKAVATYDGFYALDIPVGDGSYQIGILFGQSYDWIQLDSVEIIASEAYRKPTETACSLSCRQLLHFGSNIIIHNSDILEFQTPEAFALFVPKGRSNNGNTAMLRIVFRPLSRRISS